MNSIKLFESFEGGNKKGWKEDFLLLWDYFAELESNSYLIHADFRAGVRYSYNQLAYYCYLDTESEKIEGRTELIDNNSLTGKKIIFSVTLEIGFENNNYSIFSQNIRSASYFGDNLDIFIDIVSQLKSIKRRMSEKYITDLTLENNKVHINFIEK